jgi:hypothetical protein
VGNELSAETEESLLLEAVTREWLVKTLQDGKGLAGVMGIYKVHRSAIAL